MKNVQIICRIVLTVLQRTECKSTNKSEESNDQGTFELQDITFADTIGNKEDDTKIVESEKEEEHSQTPTFDCKQKKCIYLHCKILLEV